MQSITVTEPAIPANCGLLAQRREVVTAVVVGDEDVGQSSVTLHRFTRYEGLDLRR